MEKILDIFICRNKEQPMIAVDYVEAIKEKGLAGDKGALSKDLYSKNGAHKGGVTFVSIEAIYAANKLLNKSFLPEETGRNILTAGVNLYSLVGVTFQIGLVIFKGIEVCPPWERSLVLGKKPDFDKVFDNRGGLHANILHGGLITRGEFFLKRLG